MKCRRMIISAYGCEPGKGSEQGVGWNWVLQLSKVAELVVVTRANNRLAIEAELPINLKKRIRFVYYDLPDILKRLKRRGRGLYPYYLLWQWGAYRLMRREIAQSPVDYAMHLTFGSIWMPTFLHRLPVPFIWGLVGGGEAVYWPLIKSLPPKGRFIQYFRYVLIATFPVNPFYMIVARKARLIIARTEDTKKIFRKRDHNKIKVVLETAAVSNWFERNQKAQTLRSNAVLRVIYTGRLVPLKNLHMAIKSVAAARRRGADIRFKIVGCGPLQSALEKSADYNGISDIVTFTGQCNHDEVLNHLAESDLYLFPSLKEAGVWSLMEAMALSLPSVCVNTSGMAVIVNTSCARLIKLNSMENMVSEFADALCDFEANPEMRCKMGVNARRRLEQEFRWEQKGEIMKLLFEELELGQL